MTKEERIRKSYSYGVDKAKQLPEIIERTAINAYEAGYADGVAHGIDWNSNIEEMPMCQDVLAVTKTYDECEDEFVDPRVICVWRASSNIWIQNNRPVDRSFLFAWAPFPKYIPSEKESIDV